MKQRATLGGELLNPTDYWHNLELDNPVVLTIEGVRREQLWREGQRDPDNKPVVFFRGTTKKLVLNRTNEDLLVRMYGQDAEKWSGKKIELYRGTTRIGSNKNEPCIRVRQPTDRTEKAEPEETRPDTLGTAFARKMLAKMTELDLSMDALRSDLKAPDDSPDRWPKSYAAQVKKWIEERTPPEGE